MSELTINRTKEVKNPSWFLTEKSPKTCTVNIWPEIVRITPIRTERTVTEVSDIEAGFGETKGKRKVKSETEAGSSTPFPTDRPATKMRKTQAGVETDVKAEADTDAEAWSTRIPQYRPALVGTEIVKFQGKVGAQVERESEAMSEFPTIEADYGKPTLIPRFFWWTEPDHCDSSALKYTADNACLKCPRMLSYDDEAHTVSLPPTGRGFSAPKTYEASKLTDILFDTFVREMEDRVPSNFWNDASHYVLRQATRQEFLARPEEHSHWSRFFRYIGSDPSKARDHRYRLCTSGIEYIQRGDEVGAWKIRVYS